MSYEELEAKCLKLEFDNEKLRELAVKDFESISELTDRYIEAEKWIVGLQDMSLFKRIFFIADEVQTFLTSRLIKYDF